MPSSAKSRPKFPPPKIASRGDLKEMQRLMAQAIFRPLTENDDMQRTWSDGRPTAEVAESFIKPNDRLTSFERLEIYNRQYWFRVLDCFYDDYPGLRAVLGERKFRRLARAYLARNPSRSYTLRNLGNRLVSFLQEEPAWVAPRLELALDMARFEWAQIVAFDGEARPALTPAELQKVTPSRLRLGLQPYLSLLELHYPVDDFSIALKQQNALRNEASNAFESAPKAKKDSVLPPPKRQNAPIHIAVQRYQNGLYYKPLEPAAYRLLLALQDGATLTQACEQALKSVALDGQDWTSRIQGWFTTWSALGWFCSRSSPLKKAKK